MGVKKPCDSGKLKCLSSSAHGGQVRKGAKLVRGKNSFDRTGGVRTVEDVRGSTVWSQPADATDSEEGGKIFKTVKKPVEFLGLGRGVSARAVGGKSGVKRRRDCGGGEKTDKKRLAPESDQTNTSRNLSNLASFLLDHRVLGEGNGGEGGGGRFTATSARRWGVVRAHFGGL